MPTKKSKKKRNFTRGNPLSINTKRFGAGVVSFPELRFAVNSRYPVNLSVACPP